MVFKNLLNNQIHTPLDNLHPYDPRPSWWNKFAYYDYHQNKGHQTTNYIQLWHKIQNLIDSGEVVVGNHNKNLDHQAFKDPFPPHEKGESSNTKNVHSKVNYTYVVNHNIIHMVEPIDDEYYNVITIKGKEDTPKCKTPFVLKGHVSASFDATPS